MPHQTAPRYYAENRKARHDFETLETFQGGLELLGWEVKSVREGGAKIDGGHITVMKGELWLIGAHIKPYSKAGTLPAESADRTRKILVHRKELAYLAGKTQEKGLTLVPFSLYPARHRIKISFGVCRGRKAHDKREKLKQQDLARSIRRVLRGEDVE